MAGEDDGVIIYNLRQALVDLKALERDLEAAGEHDAGEYLRQASDRAQEIRRLIYPVYRAMLAEWRASESEGSAGDGG